MGPVPGRRGPVRWPGPRAAKTTASARRAREAGPADGAAGDIRSGDAEAREQLPGPFADLSETEDAYIAEVELPGLRCGGFSVRLAGQELVISGEVTGTAGAATALRGARPAGQFSFRVPLPGPAGPGNVTAWLADGLLTVIAPKTGP